MPMPTPTHHQAKRIKSIPIKVAPSCHVKKNVHETLEHNTVNSNVLLEFDFCIEFFVRSSYFHYVLVNGFNGYRLYKITIYMDVPT